MNAYQLISLRIYANSVVNSCCYALELGADNVEMVIRHKTFAQEIVDATLNFGDEASATAELASLARENADTLAEWLSMKGCRRTVSNAYCCAKAITAFAA